MATEHTTVNGIDLGVLQDTVRAIQQDPELGRCRFRARNRWMGANHNRSTIEGFYAAKQELSHKQTFELDADEPPLLAGRDEAPNPVEHLLNALATCLTTSIVAHASVRGIAIDALESEIEGDIDLRGFLGISKDTPKGYTNIRATFFATSDADSDQLTKLAEFSPVLNTLMSGVNVDLRVESRKAAETPASTGGGRAGTLHPDAE